MDAKKTTWARLQMLVIAAVFLGPLLIAAAMYYSGALTPETRVNRGTLLEPITPLADALPDSATLQRLHGSWALLHIDLDDCGDACRNALYTMRQSRKMLGREMDRLVRVLLHGQSAPDTVFVAAEHAGLITAEDEALSSLISTKKPAALAAGGYYLVDPLGNLVMYFEPTVIPRDMVDDIKRLLKLSRIG